MDNTPPLVLNEILVSQPQLRSHLFFKSSLTALLHALEDRVLTDADRPLVIAWLPNNRDREREEQRYRRMLAVNARVLVFAPAATDWQSQGNGLEQIALPRELPEREWHLAIVSSTFTACTICREKLGSTDEISTDRLPEIDSSRRFEGIWTFDRSVTLAAVEVLLARALWYRPDLATRIDRERRAIYAPSTTPDRPQGATGADAFVERLVTYLQAGQYKLLKAYRAIAAQETKARLLNSIGTAIRRSLDPDEVLQIAVRELAQATNACRCFIYLCRPQDTEVKIDREFIKDDSIASLAGQTWSLSQHPLFPTMVARREAIDLSELPESPASKRLRDRWQIGGWAIVPLLDRDRVFGAIEIHRAGETIQPWEKNILELAEAIAIQIGSTIVQAEAYANLEELNQQFEALDRTRANLVAITGHELRTPLSTIQVCLESIASEPDMSLDLRQAMLNTALVDAERMRKLVQDFLTLSQLESGRVKWHVEALPLEECIQLAVSGIYSRQPGSVPKVTLNISKDLPLVKADGEWLVEVLAKLLDNACKFTDPKGTIDVRATQTSESTIEIVVADSGRGIEPHLLQVVFERFYQEEGALRRTAGGTGLGLAICRQIVESWGGKIWAKSAGKQKGSQFHFTVPAIVPLSTSTK
jgi:signal transduction histidine kinase/DICT domain-containing protein